MKHKQYCFMNTQYSKEEYEKKTVEFKKKPLLEQVEIFEKYILVFPRRCHYNYTSEGCTGEYITKSKDCIDCYGMIEGENCRHVHTGFPKLRDSMRCCYAGENSELLYECLGTGADSQNISWCIVVYGKCFNVEYSENCSTSSSNIFGCSGIKQKEYCILNKKYAKGEYEKLRGGLVEHMKKTGEWGVTFDPRISPFGYSETVAMDYYPMTKEEAAQQGYNWRDDLPASSGKETVFWQHVPDSIAQIDESICKEVLVCERTGKNYKITKQELAFYKRFNISLPRLHPEERHKARMTHRNPFVSYRRQCMCDGSGHNHDGRCSVEFETPYAPNRPEAVFCEGCYQKEVI
jgi:hypothetical protein